MTIKQVLERKGHEVWSVLPDASVYEALETMARHNIGAVLVMDGATPVGIFSERDYARKVALHGRSSRETAVRDLMTPKIIGVEAHESVRDCMHLMTEHRVRHLPVYDEARLIGLVTIGDIVKAVISDQKATIEHLEDYITRG
jgi:CBS domain-containing protein